MSATMNSEQKEAVSDIQRRVDQLATQALVDQAGDNSGAALLAALSEIAAMAATAGLSDIPVLVGEMKSALARSPDEEGILLPGIWGLQGAIEVHHSRPAAAENEPAEREKAKAAPASAGSISGDTELLADFILESRDHLTSIESLLMALERDPSNTDSVHSIFRGFHTIKGLAGFMELPAIQAVAHEVETLLDMVRTGVLSITPKVVDVVLEGADYLKIDISRVEREISGEAVSAPADPQALLARIQARMSPETAEVPGVAQAPEAFQLEAPEPQAGAADLKNPETRKTVGAESRHVKVDTAKLDYLVDMVGELVIAQSMVSHDGHLNNTTNPKLQRNLSQLGRITGEVQKTAIAMRMVPIGQLFQRSVRLVRDLTRKSGKQAELELAGEETELDRTIVEELADPLMHMIRNAADHGIEHPEDRLRAAKPAVARIGLRAYHQAGHVVIEVRDDGRGLNREKILHKAVERGLVADGGQLSDKEVFGLIFEPGFSTAEKVTDISGRGVGMDVVRRQIQKMRGWVDIDSVAGKGTVFSLKVPLTLAIIDGLIVGGGEERYVVPIYVVHEMFRPSAAAVFTVENRHEMLLVRGTLLPVTRLYQRFGVVPRSTDITQSLVVVAESGAKRFCLMVDELIGKQEVVIKSLGDIFKNVPGVAGGAILGDGRVGLILDMGGLYGDLTVA